MTRRKPTDAEQILAGIFKTFGVSEKPRQRAKPHRCLGCGRVTKHVFCPKTYDECRALYRARLKEQA